MKSKKDANKESSKSFSEVPREAPIAINEETETEAKKKIEDLENEFSSETQAQKKPRGIKAQKIKNDERKKDFVQSVTGIGSLLGGLLVARLPNPIPLSQSESEGLDTAFNNLAFKYASYIENWQEETAFVMVIGMIFIPRLIKDKKTDKDKKEIKDDNGNKGN